METQAQARDINPPTQKAQSIASLQAEAHIEIRGMNAFYGKVQALKDVNLTIPKRQITVIMGPSGCGKSTLLKTLNRFLELTDGARVMGQVLIDGQDIYDPLVDETEVRKRVGLLAQRPSPLPMSIYDNVAYGMHIHRTKRGRKEYKAAVRHYLEIAGLWEEVQKRLHDPATSLSIGQQQRLCLARGLAVEPEIILGDEPTSALDPISAQNIESRLLDLKKDYTTVIVTHTLRQAKRLADYVAYMYLGEVVEAGPAREVFNNPQHQRTRAYLEGQF
ncbi:MAG TPA: phosphate ABC transporter ATP-binding protein [Anaerolineales bacterium]|nr:phosphate ABC transporter ATP-binding protein [Anaerolineales bacterium]